MTSGIDRRWARPLVVSGLLALSGLPAQALAQARTLWGTGYTNVSGSSGNPNGFRVTLPGGITASTIATRLSCYSTGVPNGAAGATTLAGLGATSAFYAPAYPAGTGAIFLELNGWSGASGCTLTTNIPGGGQKAGAWSMAMSFSGGSVDPQALRFHWVNHDAGTTQFGNGVTPNRLAGNNIFTVAGQNVHPVAGSPNNGGCQNNNGSNDAGGCGTVNFTAATPTITSLSFDGYDGILNLQQGDGYAMALSVDQPSLLIRKQTVNGSGSTGFTFNYPSNVVSNAAAGSTFVTTETIAVAANNSFVNGQQRYIANSGLDTTVTEPVPAGWRLTAASCYDVANANAVIASLAAPVVGPADATLTLPAANVQPTSQIQCDFTNTSVATVTVTKVSNGGVGSFDFTGSNGYTAHTIVTTTSGTGVAGPTNALTANSTATTITEGAPPAGFALQSISCTGLGAGGTATPTINGVSGGSVLLDAAATAAGARIACTFTNIKQPVLRLQKQLPNGRFDAGDQFALNIAGAGGPATATTTGTGSTATGTATLATATAGTAYTFSETGASGASLANYTSTYSCTNAMAGSTTPMPSNATGASFSLTPQAGDDITCTFANTRLVSTDVSITKTNTPGVNGDVDQAGDTVTGGTTTTYAVVVKNAGHDAADGAVAKDQPAAGLSGCVVTNCASAGGASCPAAPANLLTAGGVAIPALPVAGTVTFSVRCNVD